MELGGLGEFKKDIEQKNFNNVVELFVAVGRCKKKLESVEPERVKEMKTEMWKGTIQRKCEVMAEDAGKNKKTIGFNGKEGSYFYEIDSQKHKVYQVTSGVYFFSLGHLGKRELPADVAFDLAENHLPFAVLSVTSGNEINLMAQARMKADEILKVGTDAS